MGSTLELGRCTGETVHITGHALIQSALPWWHARVLGVVTAGQRLGQTAATRPDERAMTIVLFPTGTSGRGHSLNGFIGESPGLTLGGFGGMGHRA
jgi:hypothetical protein